jgi:alanine racemase
MAAEPGIRRPNWLEVDLDAITHNLTQVRQLAGPGTRVFAALKANAYGFGLVRVGQALQAASVDALAVVDPHDAVRLRENGVSAPILLYSGALVEPALVRVVEEYGLMLTAGDLPSAHVFSSAAAKTIPVFAEVDAGLERLGIPAVEAADAIEEIAHLPHLRLEGVYAHCHVSPGMSLEPYVTWQFKRLEQVLGALEKRGVHVPIAMAASSPVLLMTRAMSLNAVDVGRLLYGVLRPGIEPAPQALNLRPAFIGLKSRLVHCKRVERPDYRDQVPFPIRPNMRIGVAPMGFADGLGILHAGEALVRGRRVPLLGAPSLEHTRLDLTDVPEAGVGDEVVFIGRQGEAEIRADEILGRYGTEPPGRLAVAVQESVPRVYRTDHPA